MNKVWYAVMEDANDNDWGYGSYNYEEAVKMAKNIGKESRIEVIEEGQDPVCSEVIEYEDF